MEKKIIKNASILSIILFAAVMISFRPFMENPADSALGGTAFAVANVVLSMASIWALCFLIPASCSSITGRIMGTACLFYLTYECCIRIDSVKTLIVLVGTAVLALMYKKHRMAAVFLILSAALAGYLIYHAAADCYSIASTMPAVGPFICGALRYHNPLSAVKDYLKYEPRNIVQIPVLYAELFLAWFVFMYAGQAAEGEEKDRIRKRARYAVALSMLLWILITFAGRVFSFLGYYWVYTCAFIPSLFILMYFIKDIVLADERRVYIHAILLLMLPPVLLPARFAGAWRFMSDTAEHDTVYLYEVNPYELDKD